ncbi:SRPBCC family protein [Flavobacterium sp.]|jgi:ligand-binding SRPBCC domain-containing protein|uniref:SRPBCC family protein n=1 Tax=Flavobacterium sp. TaxID=239 RepID=UPI002A830EAF|nr:SRPBCC family protein [Flavobacterium sp.]
MTTIHLITKIKAPIETVFNNSRDITVHIKTASKTNEKAIAGISSGLIELNETVTWQGIHFGLKLQHQSKITQMQFPNHFTDEMIKGSFKSFKHEHTFTHENGTTIMEDKLMYETPFGIFGKLFDKIVLEKYLTNFLLERNRSLKILSEKQQ